MALGQAAGVAGYAAMNEGKIVQESHADFIVTELVTKFGLQIEKYRVSTETFFILNQIDNQL